MVVPLLTLTKHRELPLHKTPKHPTQAAIKAYTNTRHHSLYKVFIKEKSGISISLFLHLGGVPLVIHWREALKNRKRQGRNRIDERRRMKKPGSLGCGGRTESEETGIFELNWREDLRIYIVDQTKNISRWVEECWRGKKGQWDGNWLMFRSVVLKLFDSKAPTVYWHIQITHV